MPTLVEQIRRDAVDASIPVSALLRRAQLAASKLNLNKIEDWILKELNGYRSDVPDYRYLNGTPSAFNPHNGLIPLVLDSRSATALSTIPCGQDVSSLEHLIADVKGHLSFRYNE